LLTGLNALVVYGQENREPARAAHPYPADRPKRLSVRIQAASGEALRVILESSTHGSKGICTKPAPVSFASGARLIPLVIIYRVMPAGVEFLGCGSRSAENHKP
jgi:hypothetical protein